MEPEKAPQSEKGIKSRGILARPNGIVSEQVLSIQSMLYKFNVVN